MAKDTKSTTDPADLLAALFGVKGEELSKLLTLFDEERGAMDMESRIDPIDRMGQFRNQPYAPHASGVPYIFTGGSPFPQTQGQQRAEKVLGGGMLANNILSTGGVQNLGAALRDNVLPALWDAWKNRKKAGGQG